MILDLFPALNSLSDAEKLQLSEELSSVVFAGKPSISDEEIYAELKASLEEYHRDPSTGSTWEQVKARIAARYHA